MKDKEWDARLQTDEYTLWFMATRVIGSSYNPEEKNKVLNV